MIFYEVEELITMERAELNSYLKKMDREDMERVIRAFTVYCKRELDKKITLTHEQFDLHFKISEKRGKRGRPSLADGNLFNEEEESK